MSSNLQLMTLAGLTVVVSSLPTQNVTNSVPEGNSNHEQNELFCTPTTWRDILVLFLINYVAHAVTVKSRPGQKVASTVTDFVLALLLPYSGLMKALIALGDFSQCRHALSRAFHAGALWIVESEPDSKDNNNDSEHMEIKQVESRHPETKHLETKDLESIPRNFRGICELPNGYCLRPLTVASKISTEKGRSPADMRLYTSFNVPKALFAIIHIIFASVTLHRSRGDQISRYGYASFGLTVIPYLIASVVNLLAGILLPEYPTVFLILSKTSDEAISFGGRIEGAVGRIVETDSAEDERQSLTRVTQSQEVPVNFVKVEPRGWVEDYKGCSSLIAIFVLGAIPVTIIGSLTHFRNGHSTMIQRTFTMMWLVSDVVFGSLLGLGSSGERSYWTVKVQVEYIMGAIILYAWPAIAGFAVVGQMLKDYGSCERLF